MYQKRGICIKVMNFAELESGCRNAPPGAISIEESFHLRLKIFDFLIKNLDFLIKNLHFNLKPGLVRAASLQSAEVADGPNVPTPGKMYRNRTATIYP